MCKGQMDQTYHVTSDPRKAGLMIISTTGSNMISATVTLTSSSMRDDDDEGNHTHKPRPQQLKRRGFRMLPTETQKNNSCNALIWKYGIQPNIHLPYFILLSCFSVRIAITAAVLDKSSCVAALAALRRAKWFQVQPLVERERGGKKVLQFLGIYVIIELNYNCMIIVWFDVQTAAVTCWQLYARINACVMHFILVYCW